MKKLSIILLVITSCTHRELYMQKGNWVPTTAGYNFIPTGQWMPYTPNQFNADSLPFYFRTREVSRRGRTKLIYSYE